MLIIGLIEFLIELLVVAAGTTLVTVLVSFVALRVTGLYKHKAFLFGVPVVVAIAVGAAGPTDHTDLSQWAYFVLPTIALSVPLTLSFFWKRLPASKKLTDEKVREIGGELARNLNRSVIEEAKKRPRPPVK